MYLLFIFIRLIMPLVFILFSIITIALIHYDFEYLLSFILSYLYLFLFPHHISSQFTMLFFLCFLLFCIILILLFCSLCFLIFTISPFLSPLFYYVLLRCLFTFCCNAYFPILHHITSYLLFSLFSLDLLILSWCFCPIILIWFYLYFQFLVSFVLSMADSFSAYILCLPLILSILLPIPDFYFISYDFFLSDLSMTSILF
jgi:hypothetical protein